MCGIAGTWGIGPDGLVQNMMQRMRHRGPDGEGVCQDGTRSVLGHVRLAIIDPEHGG